MEFKTLFRILKKHLADGDDVPSFFRELMAMITTVTEEEWGTSKDPGQELSDETIRTYTKKAKLPKKLAGAIVYRLTPEILAERINERPDAARASLASDLHVCDPEIDQDNVAEKIAAMVVEIVRLSAGLAPENEIEEQARRQQAADLKSRYGSYLLRESEGYCPFGCGRQLTVSENGKTADAYEVSLIDKGKAAEPDNLIALCPLCAASWQLDSSRKKLKELKMTKKILAAHQQSTNLLNGLPLEKGITGAIVRIRKLGQQELSGASFEPVELDNLVTETTEIHDSEEIEKVRLKSRLDAERLRLETDLQTKQRRLALLDMSLESGLYPAEADLSALQEYFPQVNVRKLYEVERYHRKLAKILDDQFSVEKEQVQGEIAALQEQLQAVRGQIRELGFVGSVSKEFLDRHSELKGRIDALKLQNEAYLTLLDLQDARKKADNTLKSAITSILADIEHDVNAKMKEFNDSFYADARKAPRLHFNNYNSYTFETPDDTGTGTNYKGMVLYDLAVLYLTALPAIAHDSLIQKNISDGAIDGIMKIYTGTEKQVFIAFDKQDSYRESTRKILADNSVLKLSDENSELYGESWNKEESE